MKKRIFGFLTLCFAVVVLLASCAKKYTVNFEEEGGSEVANVQVVEGELLAEPTAPTKEGMTFGAWYSDIDLTEKYDFTQPVTGNLTLYAQWVVTLTFDSMGGSEVEPIVAKGMSVIELPEAPTRDGYVFLGWYKEKTYENEQKMLMPATNSTVYAKWQVFDEDTKLDLHSWFNNNPKAYTETVADNGDVTFTATANKGTYDYVKSMINYNVKSYNTVRMTIVGTKDVAILLKLEGGGATNIEQKFVMTGAEQTIDWTVSADNLTETGGQMFLWFLNPGVEGATEGAEEYVTIKSCALYMTKDEGQENKEAVIFFNTNGGSAQAPIYAVKGAAVTAPVAPTKEGYVFRGWYTDSEFAGQPYEFTTMPDKQVELHAKWELGTNALVDTYTPLDKDSYAIKNENGVLTVKKTGTGAWQFVKGALTGAEIINTNTLVVTVKGVAGQKITFKINDQFEKAVECDGTVQTVEINFSHLKINKTKPALLFFVNGGTEAASETFEITQLAFRNSKSVLADTYAPMDKDTYVFTPEEGVLKVKKTGTGEWQFAKGTLTGADINGYTKLTVTVKGVAGQKITFKVNDQLEKGIECDGTVQTLVIDLTNLKINKTKPALVMFVNGGVAAASETFEITQLEFTDFVPTEVALKSLDVLGDTYTTTEEKAFTMTAEAGKLSIAKTADGGEWSCVKSTLTGAAIDGMTMLKITVKGTAGEKILFKVNNQGAAEKMVEFKEDALTQTLTFKFDVSINPEVAALFIFPGAGVKGATGTFEITRLEFATYADPVNMLTDTFTTGEEKAFTMTAAADKFSIAKTADGGEWSCVKSTLTGADIEGMTMLKVTVKGTAGEKILFKVNNQGAAEKMVEFKEDALTQTLTFKFDIALAPEVAALFIFPGAGVKAATGTFEITRLEFAAVADPLDLVNDTYTTGEEKAFTMTAEAGKLAIAKTAEGGEWSCVKSTLTGADITGYTKLTITVKGTAGEKILFKVNNQGAGEKMVEFTAETLTQTVTFNISELEMNPEAAALYIFPGAGVKAATGTFEVTGLVFGN